MVRGVGVGVEGGDTAVGAPTEGRRGGGGGLSDMLAEYLCSAAGGWIDTVSSSSARLSAAACSCH